MGDTGRHAAGAAAEPEGVVNRPLSSRRPDCPVLVRLCDRRRGGRHRPSCALGCLHCALQRPTQQREGVVIRAFRCVRTKRECTTPNEWPTIAGERESICGLNRRTTDVRWQPFQRIKPGIRNHKQKQAAIANRNSTFESCWAVQPKNDVSRLSKGFRVRGPVSLLSAGTGRVLAISDTGTYREIQNFDRLDES